MKLEQETNDGIPGWDVREVGNNRHYCLSRILPGADDFDNVPGCRNQRDSVQGHAHFDDFDCLIARHVFADENVHLALDEIVHHQFLAGQLLVIMQHIDDIAVRELESDRP